MSIRSPEAPLRCFIHERIRVPSIVHQTALPLAKNNPGKSKIIHKFRQDSFAYIRNGKTFSTKILRMGIREGCKKSKWKFKMAFAIRRPTPPPLMAKFPDIFLPHFFSFAIESYIYETDFTLQKYHF